MKIRLIVTAAVLACLAATAVAQLSRESAEFGQGPLRFLLTREEAAAWKNVRTDAEAKAFIDLFWARRDPTPATPRNEYRETIEARIKFADENFQGENVRGALTDRGKVLILHGTPKRSVRIEPGRTSTMTRGEIARPMDNVEIEGGVFEWVYEGDDANASFNIDRATVRFVDRHNNQVYKLERARLDMDAAQQRAIARSIAQPALTAAPTFGAPALPTAQVPQIPSAPVVLTELVTETYRNAVAEGKTNAWAKWGEYVTARGDYFVPVGVYIPKSLGASGTEATFFGVVRDESGKNVLAFEEPATLIASKDDFFVDRSLAGLPAGKYRGTFGVAQNGRVIALASTEMELAGTLDKDATAISQLLLSNNVYPLAMAQKADDPFAFGGVKVIPKADLTFRPSDELWYFFELRNPGLADPPAGQVAVNGSELPRLPKIQVKLDVTGTDREGKPVKMAAPPRETDAIEMKGVPGHYGVGNAIPLSSFKPGDYTFTVKVIDTVKKTSYTLSEKFKIVE